MSAVFPLAALVAPDLHGAVTLALAELLPPEAALATHLRGRGSLGSTASALFEAASARRDGPDARLLGAARALDLTTADLAAVALAASVERDPAVPAALRALQGEAFGPWPGIATLARVLERWEQAGAAPLPDLGRGFGLGMLVRMGERMPAGEDRFGLAPVMLEALGLPSAEPGVRRLEVGQAPDSWRAAAATLAGLLEGQTALVLRRGDPGDKRLFAGLVAGALGRSAVAIAGDTPGFGAAALLAGWLPVETVDTLAGQRRALCPLRGYRGARLVLTALEGGVHAPGWECCEADLPPLSPAERAALWNATLPDIAATRRHSRTRIGPARLAAVAARARASAPERLRAAMGAEYRAEMEPHARLVPGDTCPGDLIADAAVTRDLAILLARCRFRGEPGNTIPGVRALLSGPSGTGKTLAAAWLATELDLPLFKLDLSAVVSKYIGETEENLARILDRAETGDMVLLMDEADSLFAKRTETRDSSDRFANNQTNYLLTRIETFDGIAILTSNGPERFDAAFARRLDQVIEVPLPAAPERRRIWRLHLGADHALKGSELNRLAGVVDLAGGHIRNIAHSARVLAAARAQPIGFADLATGVTLEYRKLGRPPPVGLER